MHHPQVKARLEAVCSLRPIPLNPGARKISKASTTFLIHRIGNEAEKSTFLSRLSLLLSPNSHPSHNPPRYVSFLIEFFACSLNPLNLCLTPCRKETFSENFPFDVFSFLAPLVPPPPAPAQGGNLDWKMKFNKCSFEANWLRSFCRKCK
jgi:hypothetical protein